MVEKPGPSRDTGRLTGHSTFTLQQLWRQSRRRLMRFERRDVRQMFAVHTPEKLAVIDSIEAIGRGKPIGEQMLADAHRQMPRTTVQPSRLT